MEGARIFVDRESARSVFERAVFGIPEDRSIIRVFHGVGGQGKTALAEELYRLSQGKSDPSFGFLNAAKVVPGKAPDPDLFLIQIRNAFARSGVPFPAFDLAFAIMWQKVRGERQLPVIENAWLHRASDAASAIVPDAIKLSVKLVEETAASVPGVGWLASAGTRWFLDRGKRAWLFQSRECLNLLYRNNELVPDAELVGLMPRILADDLRTYVDNNKRHRLVLFVDEYERIFEGAGGGGEFSRNESDRLLQRLVECAGGLLVVFFSRNRLPWEDNPVWRERLSNAHTCLDGLPEACAEEWLQKVPVPDEALRRVMIANSCETLEEGRVVYPLLLQLQVEHWHHVADTGPDAVLAFTIGDGSFEGRRRQLVDRLLGDYPHALQSALLALAPATRFDRRLFEHACRQFNLPLDMFDRLERLSIVSSAGGEWMKMHRVVADVICEILGEQRLRRAIDFLAAHFEERANPAAVSEIDDDAAVCLDEALRLRLKTSVPGAADWLADAGAMLHRAGRHAAVERLWSDCLMACRTTLGDLHRETALGLSRLACSLDAQGRYGEAEPLHRDGLRILHELGLEESVEAARASSYLANCLCELATEECIQEAVGLQGEALARYLSNLGERAIETAAAYANMAMIEIRRHRLRSAEANARTALNIRLEKLGETDVASAVSFTQLATILDLLWQGTRDAALQAEARELHQRAVQIRARVLGERHSETAESCEALAVHLNMRSLYEDAGREFSRACAIFRTALGEYHPRTGRGLINLGTNHYLAGEYEEAREVYCAARDILIVALGARHPLVASSFYNIAKAMMRIGGDKARAAIAELERAAGIFREVYPPDNFRRESCEKALVEARAMAGEPGI